MPKGVHAPSASVPDISEIRGFLPFVVSGSTCWHLAFTRDAILAFLIPYPQAFSALELQLKTVRESWPPDTPHPGQVRVIPFADIMSARLFGGSGRWRFPKLKLRTRWRPAANEGQNFAYVWYFKKGPFTPDSEKARYATDLLPRVLPVKVELVRFRQ